MDFISKLKKCKDTKWSILHNDESLFETYKDVRKVMLPYVKECEKGAMASSILEFKKKIIEHSDDYKNGNISSEEFISFVSDIPIMYLNNHGVDHIDQVFEKAEKIASCAFGVELSAYEVFLLLCAITIHDIGNILGREGHEKKSIQIFDDNVKEILKDTPERRKIMAIAMAHGGRTALGSKDTISPLATEEFLCGERIRTRELAAILRLADELADDSRRSSYGALDLGIISGISELYQDYSRVLHTVTIDDAKKNNYMIQLGFAMDVDDLEKVYKTPTSEKYLLDEIYDRTLKMERERRYCNKFINTDIHIIGIHVKIDIYGKNMLPADDPIQYTLEDCGYPTEPIDGSIKYFQDGLRDGREELEYIKNKGGKNVY